LKGALSSDEGVVKKGHHFEPCKRKGKGGGESKKTSAARL